MPAHAHDATDDPSSSGPANAVRSDAPDAEHSAERDNPIAAPDSPKAWVMRLVKGVLVGIGFILPGLSGGVLAVIFKIYDPMIRFLGNPRKDFGRNLRYFIPVGVGAAFGVLLFSIVVEAAFGRYAAQFTCLFIGFVIGTFPSLYATAGKQGRRGVHLAIMAIAAVAIFALMILGGRINLQVPPSIGAWAMSGALIGLGVIVPGMSPSNFLIYFGLYDKMAAGIADVNLSVIIPLFLGLVVCVLAFARLANWAFDTYYAGMYHAILGLVIGSSLAIFPVVVFPAYTRKGLDEAGLGLGTAVAFGIAMLVVGIIASYLFSRLEDSVADEREAIGARA